MTDGLNLCNVVNGQVGDCVALAGNALMFGPDIGTVQDGLVVVIGPFLLGVTIGAVLKIIRRSGTL